MSSGTDVRVGAKRYQEINHETFASRWHSDVSGHRERGQEPDLEKDRYAPRRALVIDACLPTPQRDSRSRGLFDMMKILRDSGYKISFLAETFDYREPFAKEMRGNGIEVLEPAPANTIETLLRETGSQYDVCLLARPAIAMRWLREAQMRCATARIVTDASDLWHEFEEGEQPRSDGTRVRAIANFGAAPAPQLNSTAVNIPHIYPCISSKAQAAPRRGIWVVTGMQDEAAADALLWLREEIIPQLESLLRSDVDSTFYSRQRDWTDLVTHGCVALQSVDENELVRATALDRFRIAVAPTRFGASLKNQLEFALSRGLPCVASRHAVAEMSGIATREIVVADTAKEFAAAIAYLLEDQNHWEHASSAALERTAGLYPYREAVESLLTVVA